MIHCVYVLLCLVACFFASGYGYVVGQKEGKAEALEESAHELKRARNLVASARRAAGDL